ncbi:metal-dependent hydrolase family protein [Ornithinicoccus halotolerans]|uniref:metal-dependent hydrolase family protein n=1 Tax=Ornithinicoccus halotolerans TaxID=1748220 RepID=UPI0012979C89|nr:amidohydrolase family protein [Ornithinicoccus halotolerans]
MTRFVLQGGEVYDGSRAAPAVADVAVEDGVIVDVGVGLDGDEGVDCAGKAVLPGFFDCHVHLTMSTNDVAEAARQPFSLQFYEAAANMRRTLAAGVTTARDAGGADHGMHVAQQRGLIAGPALQVSLNVVTQTGGHWDPWLPSTCVLDFTPPHPGRPRAVVDGPEQVRHKVRELVRAGAGVIKVATSGGVMSAGPGAGTPQFRDDEIEMLVAEASAAGLGVMAHASAAGAKTAVRHGVRSIEHGQDLDDETLELMVQRGTWLVPTLAAGAGLARSVEAGAGYPAHVLDKLAETEASRASTMRRAIQAGVRFAAGSDAPLWPHGDNLTEIELLVEYGLPPVQALHAATGSAADLLGVGDRVGSLLPGKQADLVIARGKALDVTGLSSRVEAVYQAGRQVLPAGAGAGVPG